MPPKNYSTITVELGAKQRREYERMREFAMMSLPDGEELAAPIAVSVIMRLQQMTAGTCHVDWSQDDWIEYQKALIEWEDAVNEWEFSDKKSPKPKRPAGPPITIREPSPKLDALMELIEDNEDESFVVFTNFASVAEMVKDKCDHKGISCVTYTGAVTSKELRDASVADFQSKKARVFVGTIGAAGTTITLNAAHTVVFLDRHWNPSFNEQAEDRVYRIDNDDLPVQIIDIVAKNTADEEKIQKLGTKTQWLKDFLTPRG
jgi:SNF2 family DNA or RNA helicase